MSESSEVKESSGAAPVGRDDIACPRCGYDLRGTVCAWSDQCPLEGTCTECGFRLDWRDVVFLRKPRWCVEFALDLHRLALACIVTMIMSALPWRFWKSIDRRSEVQWSRLTLYLAALLLLPFLPYAANQIRIAQMQQRLNQWRWIAQTNSSMDVVASYDRVVADGAIEAANAIAQRVDVEHLRAKYAAPPEIQESVVVEALHAIFMPWASSSRARATFANGSVEWAQPSRYATDYLRIGRQLNGRDGIVPFKVYPMQIVLLALALAVFLPVSLVLFSGSLRRACVRWTDVVRVAIYSAVFPAFVTFLLFAFAYLGPAYPRWLGKPIPEWHIPWLLLAIIPLWWWMAGHYYLRLPHAFVTIALLTALFFALVGPYCVDHHVVEPFLKLPSTYQRPFEPIGVCGNDEAWFRNR